MAPVQFTHNTIEFDSPHVSTLHMLPAQEYVEEVSDFKSLNMLSTTPASSHRTLFIASFKSDVSCITNISSPLIEKIVIDEKV
jgi:hypothetical protein